ncbi:MAG: acyltransferase [Clostridia bacterium]|nr:acyltransferase [Clostridia bacterium]
MRKERRLHPARREEGAPSGVRAAKREGGVELLRVACMLLIIGHHMAWHGMAMSTDNAFNKALATLMFAGGMTGVNSFVLITGYFLAPFRARRFFATLAETLFYSVGLTLLAQLAGWRADVTGESYLAAALVISRSPYWFVTMYLALNALLPLLQPAVKRLGRNAHLCIVALGGAYLSAIPTLTFQAPSSQYFHQITWFLYLYALGAYFRKFPNRMTRCLPLQGALFVAAQAFITIMCLWAPAHSELFQRAPGWNNFFAEKNALPQLLSSCAFFLFFANLRVKPYRALTLLSGASFGVYLIHDHSLLRQWLWGTVLKSWQASQTNGFWRLALLAPAGVYLACAAADLIRRYLLEAPLLKALNPAFDKLDGWLER